MAEASSVVETFSIDVPLTGYSEAEHARRVAERFGTSHHEFVVEAEMVPVVADAARAVGEPFADSSTIPTYLISQATRRNVTVALSGDGGDEAFGGYWRYLRALQVDRLRFLSPLARAIDGHARSFVAERAPRVERAIRRVGQSPHDRYADLMTHFTPAELDSLCTEEFKREAGGTRVAWESLRLPGYDGVNRYCRLDATTYLPGDVLLKVDRMSMAHALEVRSPFLDYRVQEHAARLPSRFKLRGNTTKWVLRELALRRGVPESAVQRPKMGFSIPVGTWFRGPLRGWITDLLLSPEAQGRGYFAPPAVERLIDAHMRSNDERGSQLWNLAMLELWHRTWIDTPAAVSDSGRPR
jgi:asparagine synthase (glutamine-hydrolysing)